ncbi:unnamed protein product [Rotaria sordida]|uniref:F-box domain-containing protein n=1 Tax=Rotaria sordida TaxID=392033 RepID=A0A815DAE4_9BILA|nr:unnamed protein product [Rotaria sordida]
MNELDMNISNNNNLNILDLPNEILLIICNKLNNVDVLYSLVDITQRFDQLVLDSFYIRNLNMTSLTMKSFYDRIYSIDNQVLERIYKNISPRIHHQINEHIVEQYSMERVLHTINYPQLYSLTLMDFSEEVLFNYLTSNRILRKLLIEQITCLKIDVKDEPTEPSSETLSIMFALILSLLTIDNKKKLPKLKHFSLTSYPHIFLYDNLIIPLLRRMINLEELILFLSIIRSNKNYIDSNELYDSILIYMPRLNKFIFNIHTNVDKKNVEIDFSSNEDIQRSFSRKEYGPVASHIESFTRENERRCYYYSLPYEFKNNSIQKQCFRLHIGIDVVSGVVVLVIVNIDVDKYLYYVVSISLI